MNEEARMRRPHLPVLMIYLGDLYNTSEVCRSRDVKPPFHDFDLMRQESIVKRKAQLAHETNYETVIKREPWIFHALMVEREEIGFAKSRSQQGQGQPKKSTASPVQPLPSSDSKSTSDLSLRAADLNKHMPRASDLASLSASSELTLTVGVHSKARRNSNIYRKINIKDDDLNSSNRYVMRQSFIL